MFLYWFGFDLPFIVYVFCNSSGNSVATPFCDLLFVFVSSDFVS